MIEFAALLSSFIASKKVKIYPMTEYCGLDRSTMYKILNGKRKPSSQEQVLKMANYMQLTPEEKRRLLDAYQVVLIGKENYIRRKHVASFIFDFAEIQRVYTTENYDLGNASLPSDLKTVAVEGYSNINAVVKWVLELELSKSSPVLYLLLQPNYDFMMNLLITLGQDRKDLKIEHIICLNNHEIIDSLNDSHYNLNCLKSLIPFWGCSCCYLPYYYYDNTKSHFNNLTLFPYALITRDAVVALSVDYKQGLLLTDDSIVRLYHKIFCNYRASTSPLVKSLDSLSANYISSFHTDFQIGEEGLFCMQTEACIVPFIDDNLVDKYIYNDLPDRDRILSLFSDHIAYSAYNLAKNRMHCYFTKEGVIHFLETGIIYELPNNLYHTIERKDRLYIIGELIKIIDIYDYRLLKDNLETLPSNLHLVTTPAYSHILFSNRNGELIQLQLEEQSLLHAFYDFTATIRNSIYVASATETKSFLQEIYKQYRP